RERSSVDSLILSRLRLLRPASLHRALRPEFNLSAAALAGAAFDADAACACADHFVAAAHGAGDSHEDAAKRHCYSIGTAMLIAPMSSGSGPAIRGIGRLICDHINHLFLASARQIGYRPVQRFFFDLGNFFERQVRLASVGRRCFLIAFDEFAREPTENVVSDAGRMTNVWIFCEPARLESLICEFFYQTFQRHAVLQSN